MVCDGFVGNVVLKTMEGLGSAIVRYFSKEYLKPPDMLAKLGALMMKPTLYSMMKQMDASEYGGALLLGVRAPFIICHSGSNQNHQKISAG